MELKTCEYCATAYDASLEQCPLCGRPSGGAPRRGGKRLKKPERPARAPKNENPGQPEEPLYAIPKWMMKLICASLGAAVLAGAIFAVSQLGWCPWRVQTQPAQQSGTELSEPAQPAAPAETKPTEQQYMNEEDRPQPEESAPESTPVACESLTLSAPSITFDEAGRFFNLTFTRLPESCEEEVLFSSSDDSIASVNAHGKITAVNAGSAIITAQCGQQSATCLVTCDFSYIAPENNAQSAEAKLNRDDMSFANAGEHFPLNVENLPDGVTVSYRSADEAVAAVSEAGLVTAVGGGTTTVTASLSNGQSLQCIVRCAFGESGGTGSACTISHSDVTMGILNEKFQLTLKDADGTKISNLLWVSSDSSICSVDGSGVVTAVGEGTAYVSTTYDGVSYQCIVRCSFR